jgi:hypothetical protein
MINQRVGDTIEDILGTQPLNNCGYLGCTPKLVEVIKSALGTFEDFRGLWEMIIVFEVLLTEWDYD